MVDVTSGTGLQDIELADTSQQERLTFLPVSGLQYAALARPRGAVDVASSRFKFAAKLFESLVDPRTV
jgi:hypothetical protein